MRRRRPRRLTARDHVARDGRLAAQEGPVGQDEVDLVGAVAERLLGVVDDALEILAAVGKFTTVAMRTGEPRRSVARPPTNCGQTQTAATGPCGVERLRAQSASMAGLGQVSTDR